MEVRTIELVPRPLEAVQFVGDNYEREAIRQWLQDRTTDGTVVLSPTSLYIQGVGGTEKVEEGEWILFDITDRWMTSATDGAVRAFYRPVPTEPEPK